MNQNVNALETSSGEATETGNAPIAEEAKLALSRASGQAREQIGEHIESRKGQAAESLSGVARAIRGASKDMENAGPLPAIANRAASSIERVADMIERRSFGDVARNLEDYARREPTIFLIGAFALGLAAGRFLRSSSGRGERLETSFRRDYEEERFGVGSVGGGSERGVTLPGEH